MKMQLEKIIIKDNRPVPVSDEDIKEGKKKTLTYHILNLHMVYHQVKSS